MATPAAAGLRILGIDPGSRFTGFGVVDKRGNQLSHVASGRIATGSGPLAERLEVIFRDLTAIITEHAPRVVAVEGLFHHKNASSALKLGHARGVALLACQLEGLDLHEYQPSVVKQAVTGSGRAEKEQVQQMIKHMLRLRGELALDASDALAVAICHAFHGPIAARIAELRPAR